MVLVEKVEYIQIWFGPSCSLNQIRSIGIPSSRLKFHALIALPIQNWDKKKSPQPQGSTRPPDSDWKLEKTTTAGLYRTFLEQCLVGKEK
jgi:hypothetical protein